MKKLGIFALSILIFASGNAFAGGFQIKEQGTKSMGMANAFTAIADDASALWFNPAGIAFQEGAQVLVGGTVIIPKVDFTSNSSNTVAIGTTSSISDQVFFPPHLYVSYNAPDGRISYGIGVNSPFGLTTEWPTTAPFAGAAQYGRLEAINVNPNLAFKVNDNFSIAAGVDYALMYNVDFNGTALRQNFDGDGWGWNAALLYKTDQFGFGVSYRSKIKVDATGKSRNAVAESANAITVTDPEMLNIGVAFLPNPDWTVSFDVDWVNWKRFTALSFTYTPALTGVGASLSVPENWKATTAFRAGAEWRYAKNMRIRAGYEFDPTPVKDEDFSPLLPDNDRHAFALGYGYDFSDHATLDLAYMYVLFLDRNQTASTGTNIVRNGLYEEDVHLIGISFSYSF